MAELKLRDVRVRYGDVEAVAGVSFDLDSGKTLALLGPSGCGKTTLLNSIAGFVDVTSGQITVGGRDVATVPVRSRGLAMVFQTHALFPHLNVADNVLFGLRATRRWGRLTAQDRSRAAETLALVRLTGFEHRYPHELSGGQRQRVALARALVVEPAVMLLDEPLSSLDAKLRAQMRIELRELQAATGVTMVYVTHDKDEAFALGDLVGVMQNGRLEQIGPPVDVCRVPRTPFVASFLTDANLLPGLVREVPTPGGTCAVALAGTADHVVRCRNPHRLRAGDRAMVAVPPTAVRVRPHEPSESGVPGQLRVAQFMGHSVHVVVVAAGTDVLAELALHGTDLPAVPAPGALVGLDWAPDDALAVPDTETPSTGPEGAAPGVASPPTVAAR